MELAGISGAAAKDAVAAIPHPIQPRAWNSPALHAGILRRPLALELIKKLELALAIFLTGASLFFVISRATHAGALWRDEAGLVQLSTTGSIHDIFSNFPHEAFPPPFPLLIRCWTTLFGASDAALRCFGAGVATLILGAIWLNAILTRSGLPLLGLALVGLNTSVLVWGSSLRGYGLAAAFVMAAFAFTALALIRPSKSIVLGTTLTGIASAQLLVHSIVLTGAVAGAAATVCLVRKKPKHLALAISAGLAVVISFLPYAGAYWHARTWDITVRMPVPHSFIWQQLNAVLADSTYQVAWPWWMALTLTLAGVLLWVRAAPKQANKAELQIAFFGLATLALAVCGYYTLMRLLSYPPRPWYVLALVCLSGVALDLLGRFSSSALVRVGRLGLAVMLLLAVPFRTYDTIIQRQTNIDVVAHEVEKQAAPPDLILVCPSWYGITFQNYYHGSTPWMTVPQLADHRMHRYDLVQERMRAADPLSEVRSAVTCTLKSGGRVWIVGELRLPNSRVPVLLSPAPDPRYGWNNIAYAESWSEQMAMFFKKHALTAPQLPIIGDDAVSEIEKASLVVAQGWRD